MVFASNEVIASHYDTENVEQANHFTKTKAHCFLGRPSRLKWYGFKKKLILHLNFYWDNNFI